MNTQNKISNIHQKYQIIDFRYYRNEPTCNDDEDSASYTLTFTLTFPHDNDTVYIAHCFPYTYRYCFEIFLFKRGNMKIS